jgi:prepilin peptidase CpaA
MPDADLIAPVFLILAGLPVVYFDLKEQVIPNVIPYTGIALGLLLLVLFRREHFLYYGVAFLLGFGIFYVFYLLGWIGGGDVKLMGMIGLLMGLRFLVQACVYIAVIGGVIGVAYLVVLLIQRRQIRAARIPYGTAIVGGTYVALFQNIVGGL